MPRTRRTITIPACYRQDSAEYSDEGLGGWNIHSILINRVVSSDETLEVELVAATIPLVAAALARAEVDLDGTIELNFTPIDDSSTSDPATIKQAQRTIYWNEWLAAVMEELEALKAKGVYEDVADIPAGKTPVDSKWVLHIKHDADGHIARFKARLVAKGFTQIPGQDFTYTFAPMARWDSIRTILAIAAFEDRELRHLDIKTTFLNGPLEEQIYMR